MGSKVSSDPNGQGMKIIAAIKVKSLPVTVLRRVVEAIFHLVWVPALGLGGSILMVDGM